MAVPAERRLHGLRVLVVDDNVAARGALIGMLAALGWRAEPASDAWDAMRAATLAADAGVPFELALIDWTMPGLDGIGCAQMLSEDLHPMAMLLMSTTFDRAEIEQRLAEQPLGGIGLLVKPVTTSRLLDVCSRALGHPAEGPTSPTGQQHRRKTCARGWMARACCSSKTTRSIRSWHSSF